MGLVLAVASLLLIAWLTLHWAILPHIERWREPIEARASRALGVPVRIGHIEVRSNGWIPSVELREVVLLDPLLRPALRLPRVFAAMSPRSLLSLELRFEQLLIEGAELEVRRDTRGQLRVGGLAFSDAESADASAADWFFAQHEFVVRGGALRWVDEQRAAPPLELRDVQFIVRNGLRHHDMRLDATPPAEWGDRFSVSGRFTQPLLARRGDWHRWSGTAYASLPRADVHALRQHMSLPFELSDGIGALRGWFELKNGQAQATTVDMALRAVALRLDPTVEVLDVEELEGRLTAQRNAQGVQLALERFTFLTGDAVRWPQGDLHLAWRQREGQPASGGQFAAQRLDVGLMAQIASRIPLGSAVRRLLAELAPRGMITDLDTQWDGPLDAPLHYRAKGLVSGLALAARASGEAGGVGRPGLRGASLQLDATEVGGQARIGMNGGELHLPGVLDEPVLALDQLSAQLLWKIESARTKEAPDAPAKVSVQVKDARFSNADVNGEIAGSWSTGTGPVLSRGGRFPGWLELDAKLSGGVATRAFRYLPLGISTATRSYVENAVQGGKVSNVAIRVRGDLWDFPFYNSRSAKDGEFRVSARVDDVTFAYVPGNPAQATASVWPALTAASADLVLDRNTLEIRNGRAQMSGLELRGVQGALRNLDTEAVLALDATARGPLGDMLHFVHATPVGGWVGHALDASTGGGNAELKLNLGLPLTHLAASSVKGSLLLAGNDIRITPDSPLLGGAKGRVDFTQKSFSLVGAAARVFGGDATFEGGLPADGALRFSGQGTATAEGLRRASEFAPLARLAGSLAGQATYRINLGFVNDQTEINLTSTLAGLAINLPAPLNKAAEVSWPLHYQTIVDAQPLPPGKPTRDTLRFELGSVVQALYQREHGSAGPSVLRGGVGVMEPAPQPAAGVAANINLKTLVTDDWEGVADSLMGASDASGAGGSTTYQPDTIALRVQELIAGSRRLTRVVAGISQDAGLWRANVDADQLNGYLEYRPPSRRGQVAATGGRLYARLSRLSLPRSDVEQVETLLDQQPASVPALDIVVDDFELRGRKLGRLEVEAVNRTTGQARDAVRDWQLTKFNLITPEAQLNATGHWAVASAGRNAAGPRRAVMDFKLAMTDSGALLERLGTHDAIRGGKGQLSGQVAWTGSPFTVDHPSLSGQVNVAIDAGQFLKADPGAARLLGVLSLQALPRRLSLDFRDVFQEGFAFDSITGDVKIAAGVAQTNNLRMRGEQAAVLMEGSADIANETQDLRVVVVPEINAGTAALAYAVINPVIGLGAFLAQALLKKPLTEAGTREFHVSGPWADPKVQPVPHHQTEGVPVVDAAASATATAKQ